MIDPEVTTRLTVMMPAYDEMLNLRDLIPAVLRSVASVPRLEAEMLVVVPGFTSTEDLAEIAALGAKAVVRGPSDTFGDAIRSGIAAIDPTTDVVVVLDADGSHDPSTIPRLLAEAPGADVVVASRYVAGGVTDNSVALRLMSRSLNLAYRVILGIDCKDVSTNFKLYRAADLRRVTLTTSDFDLVEELMFRLKVLHGKSFVIK
jgi:dolichol-phosphate mannosyltransferase